MIVISHRGNINGVNVAQENSPNYIDSALSLGFDAEIDLWFKEAQWFLGHDYPQYIINYNWLYERRGRLWVHCKNTQAVVELQNKDIHYFWHEQDKLTLTSKNYIWAFPSEDKIKQSIDVLPEKYPHVISDCLGICSDYVLDLKNKPYITS